MIKAIATAAAAATVLAMTALPAAADDDEGYGCRGGDAAQSVDALRQKLESEGWEVRRVKQEDGCYEVYGFNADGQRVEAYFDPATLNLVRSERED